MYPHAHMQMFVRASFADLAANSDDARGKKVHASGQNRVLETPRDPQPLVVQY